MRLLLAFVLMFGVAAAGDSPEQNEPSFFADVTPEQLQQITSMTGAPMGITQGDKNTRFNIAPDIFIEKGPPGLNVYISYCYEYIPTEAEEVREDVRKVIHSIYEVIKGSNRYSSPIVIRCIAFIPLPSKNRSIYLGKGHAILSGDILDRIYFNSDWKDWTDGE